MFSSVSRRSLLITLCALLFISGSTGGLWFKLHHVANPVVLENQEPGSDAWQIGRAGFRPATDLRNEVKGYASVTSVNKGQELTLYVTVTPAQAYTIDIFRFGWYQGKGGRLLAHINPSQGTQQPACPMDPVTGMISCNWAPSYRLHIPTNWTSGIYLALLTNAQHYQNYIIFVVRDDDRPATLLYQQSVATYQAYNFYPDDQIHGKSLYEAPWGPKTVVGTTRAAKVSFDRPYDSNGNGAGQFFLWESTFVQWLERSGYDVAYSTDIDTHTDGQRLLRYKGFLAVGHDEYWSAAMRTAITAARDGGVNLGFFTANTGYWRVRFEPSSTGVPNRVIVDYKGARLDPERDPNLKTEKWSYLNLPEQPLIGTDYVGGVSTIPNMPYVVANSSNWIYVGTGFKDGDQVPGIVGKEADGYVAKYPLPRNTSYITVSNSPFYENEQNKKRVFANASLYQAPSGAWVFGSATFCWGWALDKPGYVDPRIQRTTSNILDVFTGHVAK